MAATKFWLWLSSVGDPTAAWSIYQYFGDAERAYFADPSEYKNIPNLRTAQIAPFLDKESGSKLVSRIMSDCKRLGVHICTWESTDYPQRLRYIHTPPLVLYMLGRPLKLDEECVVAMAGTRRCSLYGQTMSQRFADQITRGGGLVLTGVAGGCDEAAVAGALKAGGPLAVLLPGGVDVLFEDTDFYRSLYQDILSFGTLISTYPPNTPHDHAHFRYRNRVLTGLSVATLVVEAGLRSGTLNVAACASDQGRTVYTIPANLDSATAMGTNGLLCNGLALPVLSGEDILLPYRDSFPRLRVPRPVKLSAKKGKKIRMPVLPDTPTLILTPPSQQVQEHLKEENLQKKVDTAAESDYIDLKADDSRFTDDEQAVLLALQKGDMTSEELAAETDLPSSRVLSALTMLTIGGSVEECGGGRFHAAIRVRKQ